MFGKNISELKLSSFLNVTLNRKELAGTPIVK